MCTPQASSSDRLTVREGNKRVVDGLLPSLAAMAFGVDMETQNGIWLNHLSHELLDIYSTFKNMQVVVQETGNK